MFKEDGDEWVCSETLSSHSSTVWSLSFDRSGDRLVSCSEDKTVKVWERTKDARWKCSCTLSGYHERAVYDLDWCHLTGLVATAGGDNAVCVFREEEGTASTGEVNFGLACSVKEAHSQDVNSVAWNPKIEGLMATAGDDGKIKLWNVVKEIDD